MYEINTTTILIFMNLTVKYLGVSSVICHGLIIAKAKRTLNFLHHSLWGATTAAKSVAYKSLVRPILEYAC